MSRFTGTVVAISANREHSCAIMDSGKVKCWGMNQAGQLGNGNRVSTMSPVDVVGLPGAVSNLVAGYLHTCATSQGAVWCWGNNTYGQIGHPILEMSATPVPVNE